MAVQAQHPSNVLLINRDGEQERKDQNMMDYFTGQQHPPPGFPVDQIQTTPLFFAAATNGVLNGSQRKRGRDAAAAYQMVPTPQMNLFSSSIQSPALLALVQLQSQAPPSMLSTGLKLSFEDTTQTQSQSTSFVQQDLASLISNQRDEIEQYLIAQLPKFARLRLLRPSFISLIIYCIVFIYFCRESRLRRTLADRRQRHYRALLAAAEEAAARRLREKDLELHRAVRKTAELEDRIAHLRTESLTWQAKAMSDQAAAASLHAQIQQAHLATTAHRKPGQCGDSAAVAEDAESAHVDPERGDDLGRTCRACRVSPVSVVLLPCRHLCLCSACDAAVGDSDTACCPVCNAFMTGSVQVIS